MDLSAAEAKAIESLMNRVFDLSHRRWIATLHPDECAVRPIRSRNLRCFRDDHPTPTSDCTTQPLIKHETTSG